MYRIKSPLARKLDAFVSLSDEDLLTLTQIIGVCRRFPAGRDIYHEGQKDQAAFVLAEGWAASYKMQPDGRRLIVDIQIPGDFLGLRSVLFRTSDHSVAPITPVRASVIHVADLFAAFANRPQLAAAVLWAASRDEAMVVEHLVDVGRRIAIERMAHFILELTERLRLVGLANSKGFTCPLTQYDLADTLGLSPVHVNRVLRELRGAELCTFRNGRVVIHDYDGLAKLADFDGAYLDHERSTPLKGRQAA